MNDGRLIVGITKIDITYINMKRRRRANPVTFEDKRKSVMKSIQDTTGVTVTSDVIIPLSGDWALAGSSLDSCLISNDYESKVYKERRQVADMAMEEYPDLSLPSGEGQIHIEAIRNLQASEIVNYLEQFSGLALLKDRYIILQ